MPTLLKRSRKRDLSALAAAKELRCLVCGAMETDPAHVKSRGSGGPDVSWNLMALCRTHHTEQHKIGIKTFIAKYKSVENYLLKLGWDITPKLFNKRLKENE
jgi:5-methylcytosine-specific restriction endonuclease McrA